MKVIPTDERGRPVLIDIFLIDSQRRPPTHPHTNTHITIWFSLVTVVTEFKKNGLKWELVNQLKVLLRIVLLILAISKY